MGMKDIYNNLTYDLAGSRTKNRFDFEVLFGIKQLIDNYNKMRVFIESMYLNIGDTGNIIVSK